MLHELWTQLRAMTLLEIAAALTALASVILVVRNNIWTWPWSIVSCVLYARFFEIGGLSANAGLQVLYFLPISVYAWWIWLRGGPRHNDDLPITRLSPHAWAGWLAVTVGLSILIVYGMEYGVPLIHLPADPHPYADGITTAISIVAQYLQARKWVENWPLWIVADVIYLYLFVVQHYFVTTLLYALFLVLAAMGWKEWRKLMLPQQPVEAGILEA